MEQGQMDLIWVGIHGVSIGSAVADVPISDLAGLSQNTYS